ncbi:protein-lysine n-methyltransferase mettl10 [Holotrichia oblita]|uniref:Protein-lysine n-methyltransferase mettl10 n=1 Tax=Holotrichia oblita TaxID=644536 RepID=A0ACB9TV03_HOLOL|nr:protein-lysine n-methyltransferase mettl10 [Holotrichia oblita]
MCEELEHCELGTQEYWNNRYQEEVKNYQSHGDVGEIWFGEDIVDRIIKWMKTAHSEKSCRVLDIGCGNGMLLIELYNEGFKNVVGVDYSENAITLAKSIATKLQCNIEFSVCDIIDENIKLSDFDVILDKGSYDAISLSFNAKENRNKYIENVHKILKATGILIITSCNWTQEELIEQFKTHFDLKECIPTPEYKFGGKVGNIVTSIVFKQKINIENYLFYFILNTIHY